MVTVDQYRENQRLNRLKESCFRKVCPTCLQPQFACYCRVVQRFDPKMTFVILIHPVESRKRLATGRMSHLSLVNSHLWRGSNFSDHEQVNRLLSDPQIYPVVLYPGPLSKNLTNMDHRERAAIVPSGKKLVIFVIDGTWGTAGKMIRESSNLCFLPRICFSPPRQSSFRVRKQPNPKCLSTIEAIHHTIELMGSGQGFDISQGLHDSLLQTFDILVSQQLEFVPEWGRCGVGK